VPTVVRVPSHPELFTDADYPAAPYPGCVPDDSFVHLDGTGYLLHPDPTRRSGWRLGDADLDDWLAQHGAVPLARRVPVLVYGSNRCPSKITWLRGRLGLPGPAVVLRAVTEGVSAVWAAGLRQRDGQRPAVLAAAPGVTEWHAVWLATPEQVAVLDRCEGRGERYRLARLRTGRVHTADGAIVDRPWCYLAAGPARAPLLVAGTPVPCTAVDQWDALGLQGTPAPSDGLLADEVVGAPHPDQWPSALFSYGLLRPGRDGWRLVEPHVAGVPRLAHARGSVYDTGLGWPAMLLDALEPSQPNEAGVPGVLIPLRDPAGLLPVLDEYEGHEYRRVRLVMASDGTVTWAYVWVGDRERLAPIGSARSPEPARPARRD
jgi:gamma-glutamylcyclotransferase (GGCT)/AIG2-like uncharacterized protein YtfP